MSGCTQCGTTAGQLERRNREAAKQWEDNVTAPTLFEVS